MKHNIRLVSFLLLPLSLLITLVTVSCKSGDTTSTSKTDQTEPGGQEERLVAETDSSESSAGLAGKKPNVVFVLTDDQGMGDLSCMGNPFLKTPHIDSFYAKSSRFSDFHVSPTC